MRTRCQCQVAAIMHCSKVGGEIACDNANLRKAGGPKPLIPKKASASLAAGLKDAIQLCVLLVPAQRDAGINVAKNPVEGMKPQTIQQESARRHAIKRAWTAPRRFA